MFVWIQSWAGDWSPHLPPSGSITHWLLADKAPQTCFISEVMHNCLFRLISPPRGRHHLGKHSKTRGGWKSKAGLFLLKQFQQNYNYCSALIPSGSGCYATARKVRYTCCRQSEQEKSQLIDRRYACTSPNKGITFPPFIPCHRQLSFVILKISHQSISLWDHNSPPSLVQHKSLSQLWIFTCSNQAPSHRPLPRQRNSISELQLFSSSTFPNLGNSHSEPIHK